MYLGLHFEYLGASSVGCLALTVLSSFAWERGFPRYFSKGEPACRTLPCPYCIHV